MNIINQALSALLQLALVTSIPFIWYIIFHKKCSGFFQWIGLKAPAIFNKSLLKFIIFTLLAFTAFSIGILYSLKEVGTAASIFSGMGIVALPSAIVYAFFTTKCSFWIVAWCNVLFAN